MRGVGRAAGCGRRGPPYRGVQAVARGRVPDNVDGRAAIVAVGRLRAVRVSGRGRRNGGRWCLRAAAGDRRGGVHVGQGRGGGVARHEDGRGARVLRGRRPRWPGRGTRRAHGVAEGRA